MVTAELEKVWLQVYGCVCSRGVMLGLPSYQFRRPT